jgi:hypothetical protein
MSAAAVGSATTAVEASASAAMEASASAAAVESTAAAKAMRSAAGISMAAVAATISAAVATASAISATVAYAAAISISAVAATAIPAMGIAPTATVPGAGTEKDTAIEPRRAVVAIGRASIGSIAIVAVLTYRRTIAIDADADGNLRLGLLRRSEHETHADCRNHR